MSQDFLAVLNLRDMASKQILYFKRFNTTFASCDSISKDIAHGRSILQITRIEEIGAENRK